MGRETGSEYNAEDGCANMSKRFMRWVENWIEEKIPAGANPDLESHEARAARLTKELYDEAASRSLRSTRIGSASRP